MAIRNSLIGLIILSIISCSAPKVEITSDFDRGSLGEMQEIEPNHFKGKTKHWKKRDSIGDQRYWFYFKADNVKDKELTFSLTDMVGVYRGNKHVVYTDYTQPVFSYDQENWLRIPGGKYDSASRTFQFSQTFNAEPVWIAYAHPYPTSRLKTLLTEIQKSEYLETESIAKTKEGRDITLMSIRDSKVSDTEKKNIMIMAMQHAGEDAGGFMAEGMINFLLSEDPEAKKAREHFNYIIVPMMNPDGTYNGESRYNMELEDLNNVWLDDEHVQPENLGVKDWVEAWYADGKEIDLFLDIHNHTQFHTYNVIIYEDQIFDSLNPIMDKYWPTRGAKSKFRGSSGGWFATKDIPGGTVELSQGYLEGEDYLTIEDYHDFGKGAVLALTEYFYTE